MGKYMGSVGKNPSETGREGRHPRHHGQAWQTPLESLRWRCQQGRADKERVAAGRARGRVVGPSPRKPLFSHRGRSEERLGKWETGDMCKNDST